MSEHMKYTYDQAYAIIADALHEAALEIDAKGTGMMASAFSKHIGSTAERAAETYINWPDLDWDPGDTGPKTG